MSIGGGIGRRLPAIHCSRVFRSACMKERTPCRGSAVYGMMAWASLDGSLGEDEREGRYLRS